MKRPLVKRMKVFKIKYFLIRTFLAPRALNKPTIFVRSSTKISKIEIIFIDEIMTIIENINKIFLSNNFIHSKIEKYLILIFTTS